MLYYKGELYSVSSKTNRQTGEVKYYMEFLSIDEETKKPTITSVKIADTQDLAAVRGMMGSPVRVEVSLFSPNDNGSVYISQVKNAPVTKIAAKAA
jgi:hypothetical protein